MPTKPKADDAATVRRFEAALRRALDTPPDQVRKKAKAKKRRRKR